jgi:glycosyltransferase involved in cell wall biosynthesis
MDEIMTKTIKSSEESLRNILYLSYDGMTDPLGQSQVLPYLSGLSKEGFAIFLISFEKKAAYLLHKAAIQAICDDAGITWLPQSYSKRPPLLSTIYDVMRMYFVAQKLHKKHNFLLVHARSYISALIGIKLKQKYGLKFLFDMRGFWADERVEGGIWRLENPIYKVIYSYFKKKEVTFIRTADHIISLTENGKKEIEKWEIGATDKLPITVIPCCVNTDLFNPDNISEAAKQALRNRLSFSNETFVLGYVGSIGTWYMLSEMLDYFQRLKQQQKNATFLFVTGDDTAPIERLVEQKGIHLNDIQCVSCSHIEVPLHISIFNASLFFIRPSYSKKASSPTKQGEIMAMGIPLLCNAGIGDTDFLVKKYAAGAIIPEFTHQAYLDNLSFYENFSATRSKQGAHDYFQLADGIQKYNQIYHSLVAKK